MLNKRQRDCLILNIFDLLVENGDQNEDSSSQEQQDEEQTRNRRIHWRISVIPFEKEWSPVLPKRKFLKYVLDLATTRIPIRLAWINERFFIFHNFYYKNHKYNHLLIILLISIICLYILLIYSFMTLFSSIIYSNLSILYLSVTFSRSPSWFLLEIRSTD